MSATTMAVATSTETVDPPLGSWPGHATLPVSDVVMSAHAPLIFSSCGPGPTNSSNVNKDLSLGRNLVFSYLWGRLICGIAKTSLPPHNRDTISCFLRLSGVG